MPRTPILRLSVCQSVCLSICLSVCHACGQRHERKIKSSPTYSVHLLSIVYLQRTGIEEEELELFFLFELFLCFA